MQRIVRFFHRMDASIWRAVIITALLLTSVLAVLIAGRMFLFDGETNGILGQVQDFLLSMRSSVFGLPLVILLYCGLAFLGAPQFGLIGATVLAFGPTLGFMYSWVATLVSASMAFWIGRVFGLNIVRKYGGDSISRLSRFMRKNDFLASAIVRNVPTAPAIVVNMAFGTTESRYIWFLAGAAVGIVPKILIIALFGEAVAQSMTGNPVFAGIAVTVMAVIWIPIMLVARSNIARQSRAAGAAKPAPDPDGEPLV